MKCEAAREALSAALDGEAARSDALEDHLAGCAGCRSFERSAEAVRRELRFQTVGPSTDVTEAVLAVAQGVARTERSFRERSDRRSANGWLPAVAAVLLIAMTGGAFLFGRLSVPAQEIAAVDDRAVSASAQSSSTPDDEMVSDERSSTLDGGRTSPDSERNPGVATGLDALLTVWMPGRLDPNVLTGLRELESVDAVVAVRRATLGLSGSIDADGRPVDVLDSGWTIPLDVLAVDQVGYGAALESQEIAELGPGQGLLGASSALVRGLGIGSTLWIDGREVEVAGVVDDELIGKAELVVGAATGDELGVTAIRYALLVSATMQATLEERIAAMTDRPFRLSNRRQSPTLRNSDGVQPQVELKARFGEFALRSSGTGLAVDPGWFEANVVVASLPLVGRITCHRLVVSALDGAVTELIARGFEGVFDATRFQGCWNPRLIGGTDDLSHHAWGTAVDLLDTEAADRLDPVVVEIMERHGFTWGGDWLSPDPAHFEYVGVDP